MGRTVAVQLALGASPEFHVVGGGGRDVNPLSLLSLQEAPLQKQAGLPLHLYSWLLPVLRKHSMLDVWGRAGGKEGRWEGKKGRS